MFDLEVQNVISTHQQFLQMSDNFTKTKTEQLKQQLKKIESKDVLVNFYALIKELADVEIWSPRLTWLHGCYTSSCHNVLNQHKWKQPGEMNYSDIRATISQLYNALCYPNAADQHYEIFSLFKELMSCLEKNGKYGNPSVLFALYITTTLCGVINDIGLENVTLKLPNFSYASEEIIEISSNLSLSFLLIDIMITMVNIFSNLVQPITSFIIAPYVQLLVFAHYVGHEVLSYVLVVTPTSICILGNKNSGTLLGILTINKTVTSLKIYLDYIEETFGSSPELQKYKELYDRMENCAIFLEGRSHKTLYNDYTVDQFICPLHYSVDASDINMLDLLKGIFQSCFLTCDAPGIVDEETGEVLVEYECTKEFTTWFNICAYYFFPYMKTLGSDIYEFKLHPKPVTFEMQRSFVLTSAHYFLDDTDVIKTYWANSLYWKVLPLPIKAFFLPNLVESCQSVYKLLVPNAFSSNKTTELHVNEEFQMVYEMEHRRTDVGTYTSLLFARFDPCVRSFVLLFNLCNEYTIFGLFPLLNNSCMSLVPLSLQYKDCNEQYTLISKLIQSHAKQGKEVLKEQIQSLFPI